MRISRITTERVRQARHGLVAAANIEGEDLAPRAIPLVVRFGDVEATGVTPLLTAKGVRAVFGRMPQPGARLSIGYMDHPLERTPFTWRAPDEGLTDPASEPPPRREV